MDSLGRAVGKVHVSRWRESVRLLVIQPQDDEGRPAGPLRVQQVPRRGGLRFSAGDYVRAGELVTYGRTDPHDLLRILGREAAQEHLLRELQYCYRLSRLAIDDRHFEVLLARMLCWAKVETAGDTALVPDTVLHQNAVRQANKAASRPATCKPCLLGVSDAARHGESFLSAPATRGLGDTLSRAALTAAVDRLDGLHVNLLLGRLIPAGTGFREIAAVPSGRESQGSQSGSIPSGSPGAGLAPR
jgi:DNA-directed RNA polymerase subunit beta'